MEILIRGFIWSLLLSGYTWLIFNKKRAKDVEKKFQIIFSAVTAYALVIVSRSAVFRLSRVIGSPALLNEVLNVLCVVAGYHAICFFSVCLLKETYRKWISYFVSWICSIALISYLIIGYFNNEIYVIIYCISFAASLVMAKIRDDKIQPIKSSVWKARLKFSLPVGVFSIFTFCIYLPSELYLGNPENFKVGYWEFIFPLLIQCILFILVYLVITLFLITKNHYYACNISAAMFALLSHIQSMFLNGELQSMDGTPQKWSIGTVAGNVAVWCVILLAVFIVSCYKQKKVRDILKVVAYGGIGIQIVSLGILLAITPNDSGKHRYVLSMEGAFEMAPEDNVIVFVLDWFDNQIVEKIEKEDTDFFAKLDGFTYYPNTTSRYAFTDMSVVYLLTGKEWEYDMLERKYANRANEESDMLEKIADSDYTLGIYTLPAYIGGGRDSLDIENGTYSTISLDVESQLKVMAKTARYKVFPFALKNHYLYSDDEIYKLQVTDVPLHNINDDIPFAEKLFAEGVTIDKERNGAFKFYHLRGAHKPYRMNEEFIECDSNLVVQSRATFEIVYEYMEQLKENGLYEDATIIITADHGQNYYNVPHEAEELDLEMVSSPILFVKYAGECDTEMKVSKAPVSHEEIMPTILQIITGDTQGYGRTIDEIAEDEERVREFIYGRHDDIPFVRYEIAGDVSELESWSEPVLITE